MMRHRGLLALLAAALALPAIVAMEDAACTEPAVTDAAVSSFDGTQIAITTFQPCGVDASLPAPVILTSHGWGGQRATSPDTDVVASFLAAGYGVVSIDARGHGESGGEARIHHPDWEVRDFRAVLSWIYDELPWVQRQPETGLFKDVVVGAYGGSYGGGFQLMTAAFDDRLDALVPMHTWHDLREALAPNRGAIKSWLTLLYASGKANATLAPEIDAWYLEAMRDNIASHEALHHLYQSSPIHWMPRIDVPALLIQGMPDTLFNLNQAVANYQGIRANGVEDVRLIGVNDGHLLPGAQPTEISAAPRVEGSPCADLDAVVMDFLDTHLRSDPAASERLAQVPRVILPTEQGGCVTGPDWPLDSEPLEFSFPALAAPNPAGSVLLPLFTAEEETTLAGIPTLDATTLSELDDFLYLSLVVRSGDGIRVIDDQVTGLRIRPTGCRAAASSTGISVSAALAADARCAAGAKGPPFTLQLGGIATTLQPGDDLLLKVDGWNEQFALNGNRRPGAGVITGVRLTVPVVDTPATP